MPLVDYNTRQIYDELYSVGAEGLWGHPNTRAEVKLHYCRGILWPQHAARYASYYIDLGLRSTQTFTISGAGFGFTCEYLLDVHGYTGGVGLDTSAYIQSNKDLSDQLEIEEWMTGILVPTDARWKEILDEFSSNGINHSGTSDGRRTRTAILNEDGSTANSRANIRNHLGVQPNDSLDWAISEGVIESFTDSEVVAESGFWHSFANNVAHVFIPLDPDKFASGRQDSRLNWKSLADWRALLPNDYLINGQTGAVDVP